MPRQIIMAFSPVKLILLAVILIQAASVIAVPTCMFANEHATNQWIPDYGLDGGHGPVDAFGAPA